MRLFGNIDNATIQNLIIEASLSLLDREVEIEVSQANLELIGDALSALISGVNLDQFDLDQFTPSQVRTIEDRIMIIREMLNFLPELRRIYKIHNPVEAFLVWLSVVTKQSTEQILEGDITSTILSISRQDREDREKELLEFQENENKERMQKVLGGLPLVTCAMQVTILGLSKISTELENTLGKRLRARKLKKNNSGPIKRLKMGGEINKIRKSDLLRLKPESLAKEDYATMQKHKTNDAVYLILVDCSGSMTTQVYNSPEIRRYNYAAGAILEVLKFSNESETFIAFFDECIQYKISLKKRGAKVEFWQWFGYDKFNGGGTNVSAAILEMLELPEFKKVSKGKETSVVIITDGEDSLNIDEMADLLDKRKISLNVMLLNEEKRELDIVKLVRKTNGNLFVLKDGSLVEDEE